MQRKPTKQSPGPNAAERRHATWVKFGTTCAACNKYACLIVHHCEGSTFRHNKTLIGHWFILGLCQDCDDIVTFSCRRHFREEYGPQSALWAKQIAQYAANDECPEEVKQAILDWGK